MSEWKEIEFAECLIDESISYGIVQPGSDVRTNSVPIIRVQNIKNGVIDTSDVRHVSKEIEEKYYRTRLQGGELLITVVGSVGETAIVPESLKGWNVARAVSVAKIKDIYNKYFIKYLFATEDAIFQMYGNTNDTVQPTLNLKELKRLVFRIPEKNEQDEIAEVLSSLDDKIDLLHRQNRTLEQMAETLFRQWFVEEADEGWEEVTLKSLCEIITKGTTPTSLKRQFVEVGINFIKVNCIDDKGNFLYDKFNFIDEETHNVALKRSILQEGDFLYSIAGTIGRISEVTQEVLPANVNQALAILRVDSELVNPYYVKYSLKDPNVTFDLHSKIVHAVQPNLSLGEIGSTLIPLPDKETRQKFNEVINPVQEKIKSNQTQIRTLTALRDTLLPKLMSGEVRVNI